MSESDPVSNRWEDAGFGVGLKRSETGVSEGVYVFFNFHPQNNYDGGRYEWSGDSWGQTCAEQ
jgi:hypothetical protein